MTRVYLTRHATHDLVGVALAGRMEGVALSAEGHDQAERLVGFFAGREVGSVLSSPMERCRQTAAPLAQALGLPVEVRDALTELDCGSWTGKRFDALHDDPRWASWNSERGRTSMPGGESIAAVRDRVMALIHALAAANGPPAVLVTHSDVIKVVVLALLDASLDLHDRLEIDPASVTTVDLWAGGGKIVRSNEATA